MSSLIAAQSSGAKTEGQLLAGAVAFGLMAASNLPYYGVSKTVDFVADKAKSFVDSNRNNQHVQNSVGPIDPSNFLSDDGSSKISPDSLHPDSRERGRGSVEI